MAQVWSTQILCWELMPSVHFFMHEHVLTINTWLGFCGLRSCFGLSSPCVTAGKGLEKPRTPQPCSGQKATIWNRTLTPWSTSYIWPSSWPRWSLTLSNCTGSLGKGRAIMVICYCPLLTQQPLRNLLHRQHGDTVISNTIPHQTTQN